MAKKAKAKRRSLEDAEKIIERLVEDYEDQGCDGCGTVSKAAINEARRYLGMEQLGDDDGDEIDDLDEDEEEKADDLDNE
jgi:hypothetical protein